MYATNAAKIAILFFTRLLPLDFGSTRHPIYQSIRGQTAFAALTENRGLFPALVALARPRSPRINYLRAGFRGRFSVRSFNSDDRVLGRPELLRSWMV